MIKEAGFNTIRTAGGLTPDLVLLARKHGLMVMHGIWFDGNIDYSDSSRIKYACDMLKSDLAWSKDFDNILCFLVMNEPAMERVRDAGKIKTEQFLKTLRETVKTIAPEKPVSFAGWAPLIFIDYSFWDAVCFNAYIYSPVTIAYSLDYMEYIERLKKELAGDKPFVITEFGLSVSKKCLGKSTGGHYCYGGNTPEEQKTGDISMYDSLIQAGASGGCVFEWLDSWWMAGGKSYQDADPEEWFGIVEIDKDLKSVRPRPVYYALKEYNQAIVIEPKRFDFYSKELPIEIYSTEEAVLIQVKLNNMKWQDLKKEGNFWWRTTLDISKLLDGRHNLRIKVLDKNNELLYHKKQDIWIANKAKDIIPYKVTIAFDRDEYKTEERMELVITIADAHGNPIPNQIVYYSFFQPIGWEENSFQEVTDLEGKVTARFSTCTPGYVTIAAGVEYKDGDYKRRYGDVKTVLFK